MVWYFMASDLISTRKHEPFACLCALWAHGEPVTFDLLTISQQYLSITITCLCWKEKTWWSSETHEVPCFMSSSDLWPCKQWLVVELISITKHDACVCGFLTVTLKCRSRSHWKLINTPHRYGDGGKHTGCCFKHQAKVCVCVCASHLCEVSWIP